MPDRYDRQVILPGIGKEGQDKLRNSRVLVVGAGGLGSPVSLYLAAAGVGTIGIADPDTVDVTNLHRQILHGDSGLGIPKVESARIRIRELNPEVNVELYPEGVTTENAVSLFSNYDVIVDGTDNFPTRFLNNDAAYFAGKPLVYGSIFQFEGQVSVFHPAAGGPCYRCLFPTLPEPGAVPNCAEAGVLGSLCGIVGSWQANEALKLILGIGEPLIGKMKVIQTLTGREQLVRLKKDPNCPLCGDKPSITEISDPSYQFSCNMNSETSSLPLELTVEEAQEVVQSNPSATLLDVRQPEERATASIDNSIFHPLATIPHALGSLPKDGPILVYCHHGMRSLRAAHFLRENGFSSAQSVKGGINAWSLKIDPTVPRY